MFHQRLRWLLILEIQRLKRLAIFLTLATRSNAKWCRKGGSSERGCRGNFEALTTSPKVNSVARLVFHDLSLAILSQFVDLAFVGLDQLLNFILNLIPLVLGQVLVFLCLIGRLIAVTPDIA